MMITEQFKAKRCVFSIECFPPKQTTQMDKLKDTLRQMQAIISASSASPSVRADLRAASPPRRWPTTFRTSCMSPRWRT